jgi:hypothetical protein
MTRSSLAGLLLVLVACAPSGLVHLSSSPSPASSATTEIPTCSGERQKFLVEQFFSRYNARDLEGFLALFNWASPAIGGGFASYTDNPGESQQLNDRASLADYVRRRWALEDRFAIGRVDAPADAAFPNANPTVDFARSFSGASQTGTAKLVCNAGLLVGVVMSSRGR